MRRTRCEACGGRIIIIPDATGKVLVLDGAEERRAVIRGTGAFKIGVLADTYAEHTYTCADRILSEPEGAPV